LLSGEIKNIEKGKAQHHFIDNKGEQKHHRNIPFCLAGLYINLL
jgi:hypothetical protein